MNKIEVSFKNEPEGIFTVDAVNRLFNFPPNTLGPKEGLCSIVKNPVDPTSNVLQIKYPKDIIQEKKLTWKFKFEKPVESATLTYKVMFPVGFEFVRGGKLPGLCGGSAPMGGAKSDGSDGFSERIMWREGGQVFEYMYWMERSAEKRWGEDLPLINLDGDMTPFSFIPGQWHTLTTRIVMNTPGERDGNISSWFDGKLGLSTIGAFRAKGATFGIDAFKFTTFFGGNDLTWAPKKDEVVYFGDISIELD
jgi:hypothetical protein